MTLDENAIVEILSSTLLSGRLAPGLRLGEHHLAGVFGVSRERVRAALRRLGHTRLIELHPNRGAFVTEPGLDQAREVYEARRIVETGVVIRLTETIGEQSLRKLEAHVEREQAALDLGYRAESVRLSGLFHAHLADFTGNAPVAGFLRELVSRTAMLVAYHEGGAADCGCAEHRAILGAVRSRDANAAAQEMQRHLSLIETRLQVLRVFPTTSDVEAILGEEIERWRRAGARSEEAAPKPAGRRATAAGRGSP
jgi:DNA-binding GntR family transcriptional regulator